MKCDRVSGICGTAPPLWRRIRPVLSVMLVLLALRSVQASPPSPGGETNTILQSWSFQDTTNWSNDGGYVPLSYTNLGVSDLGDGTAVVVDATNYAWLRYNVVETNGTTNLTINHGTVSFWFAPTWAGTNQGGTGPGDWGRLIEAGAYTTNASYGWWSLYFDPAGTHLYFSSQTNNGLQDTYLSGAIACKTNFWHFIALTYDATNCALYLDGQLVTNGLALSCWPGTNILTNGFTIGSDGSGTIQAHGMFDDLVTFSYPLDANTISGMFLDGVVYFLLNPMNAANLTQAPSQPVTTPTFEAITGSGFLTPIATNTSCLTSSNIWLTNVSAAYANNGTMNLTFTIAGGSNGCVYDVFATPTLEYPLAAGQWYWMGQGPHCVTYTITNLPAYSAMFILGTPQDSDGDGLTDAYELLVSHTDPNNPDTFSTGMSDGWQIAYFGYVGVNGYTLCSSGDGWTYIQAYQNGWNPTDYHTPPTPTGLNANYYSGVATLTWNPSPGPVLSYIIERDIPSLGTTAFFTNSASSTTHQDDPFPTTEPDLNYEDPPTYEVTAVYLRGNSATSQVALYGFPNNAPFFRPGYDYGAAAFVRGPLGNLYLAWSRVPTNLPTVQLVRESWNGTEYVFTNWTIATSNFANGIYEYPVGALPSPSISVSEIWSFQFTNSNLGIAPMVIDAALLSTIPFFDGREQMKENLWFAFRAAAQIPFEFEWYGGTWDWSYAFPTNYVYSGFFNLGTSYGGSLPVSQYEYSPFVFNAAYRNLEVGETNDLNSEGWLSTDVAAYVNDPPELETPSGYQFAAPTTTNAIPGLLSSNSVIMVSLIPSDFGVTVVGTNYAMASNAKNIYGLPFTSAVLAWNNTASGSRVLNSGGTIPYQAGYLYAQAADPQLQTSGYYFTQFPADFPLDPALTPIPGQTGFSPTNPTPPLIVSVGDPHFKIAGYAKQALLNGDPNVFGFLGQYFASALLMNPDGSVSTNQTGLLSPYGDFFPTQPGAVALVTMPDLDTGKCGTGVVNVIKLQLDVNHDGYMDLSYGGPDNTSPERPYTFWINSDFDRAKYDSADSTSYEDSVLTGDCPYTPGQVTPDYSYRNSNGTRIIPTERDLQDFTRLWICGITSNLLEVLPAGTTITLDWGDVGSPNTNNPVIDLFVAADADGGIGYLTNSDMAAIQTNALTCPYIGRLGPGGSIQLNASRFADTWAGNFFIWCGAASGTGALRLTVWQGGTNPIASTTAYIQLQDIKELYERWTVGDSPWVPMTNVAQLAQEDVPQPFQYAPNSATNTPYILYVHGWNMERWEKDRFAESAFKRLYWQGYQGRFGEFRWPTYFNFSGQFSQIVTNSAEKDNFDNSEFNAWRSAGPLKSKLNDLNSQYPGRVYILAHSMGNIPAGEALRLEGTNQVVQTYVASQAALPAHVFDSSIADYAFTISVFGINYSFGPKVPNIYGSWLAGINGGGAGRVINYYNTNDYALARLHWQLDQLFKPDTRVLESGTNWSYGYTGTTNDPPPWNNFWKQNGGLFGPPIVVSFDIVNSLTDRYEVMAYAAQSYTTALGATPSVGRVAANLPLINVWPSPDPLGNNFASHFYHSAEFRGDAVWQWSYWNTLLYSKTLGFNILNQ